MADSYRSTELTSEEKKQANRARLGQESMEALSMGAQYATLGATVGSAVPGLGTALGAGIGFLVGAGASVGQYFFSERDDFKAEKQAMAAEKQAARAREDEQRALQAAQSLAKKGPDVSVRNLPGAPSDENILMGSMPVRMGGSAPMDPYRQTVRNKFGWS